MEEYNDDDVDIESDRYVPFNISQYGACSGLGVCHGNELECRLAMWTWDCRLDRRRCSPALTSGKEWP
jgi:hypothetical protein